MSEKYILVIDEGTSGTRAPDRASQIRGQECALPGDIVCPPGGPKPQGAAWTGRAAR